MFQVYKFFIYQSANEELSGKSTSLLFIMHMDHAYDEDNICASRVSGQRSAHTIYGHETITKMRTNDWAIREKKNIEQ